METTQPHQINTITNEKIPQDPIPNESKLIGEVFSFYINNLDRFRVCEER